MKISELYEYAGDNNLKLLFTASAVSYPTIEGNTSNFLTDYEANSAKLDRLFYRKYASMKTVSKDEDTTAATFTEWKSDVNSILYYYLDAWARLYYALSLAYNPLYNVDGETKTETKGKIEGLSGSDTTDLDNKEQKRTSVYGSHTDTDTSYEVPFDTTTEKETGKESTSIGGYTDTHTDQAHKDQHKITYGKKNDVDYTVTETRAGNIGTTKTTDLLGSEWELRKRSFWENVFKSIVKELLYW